MLTVREATVFWVVSASAQRGFESQRGGEPLLPLGHAKGLLAVHTGAEGGQFMCHERLINPRCPLLGQRNRGGICEMRHAQARPGPLDSLFDQPGTNGIAQHITQDGQEMAVLLKGKNFEAPLPDMPMTPVVPMVAADMTGHPALHEAAQCSGGGRLHH